VAEHLDTARAELLAFTASLARYDCPQRWSRGPRSQRGPQPPWLAGSRQLWPSQGHGPLSSRATTQVGTGHGRHPPVRGTIPSAARPE